MSVLPSSYSFYRTVDETHYFVTVGARGIAGLLRFAGSREVALVAATELERCLLRFIIAWLEGDDQ